MSFEYLWKKKKVGNSLFYRSRWRRWGKTRMEWMLLLERRQQGKESLHLQKKKPLGRILQECLVMIFLPWAVYLLTGSRIPRGVRQYVVDIRQSNRIWMLTPSQWRLIKLINFDWLVEFEIAFCRFCCTIILYYIIENTKMCR